MKFSVLALPLALALVTGVATAAEPIEGQFSVSGTVPTESFSIIDPANWMGQTQSLEWNNIGGSFRTFNQKLMIKSTVGAVTGHLLAPAEIISPDNSIAMVVEINHIKLTDTPQQIVNASMAAPGREVIFRVTARDGVNANYLPGDYRGSVNMMFETAPPL